MTQLGRSGGGLKDKSSGWVQKETGETHTNDWTLQDSTYVPNSLGTGGHSPESPFESSGMVEFTRSGPKSCTRLQSTVASGETDEYIHAPKDHEYGVEEEMVDLPRVGIQDDSSELDPYHGRTESDQLSPSRRLSGTSVYGKIEEIEVKTTYNKRWTPEAIENQVMVQIPRGSGKGRGVKTFYKVHWKGRDAADQRNWIEDKDFYHLLDYDLPWQKWQSTLAQLMGERVRKPRGPQVKKDVPEEEKEAKKIEKAKKRKSTAPKKKRTKSDSEEEYGTKKKSKTSKKEAKEESSDEEDEEYKSHYEDTEWPTKRRR